MKNHDSIRAIKWCDDALVLIDQRKLPQQLTTLEVQDAEQAAYAIKQMVVRGAPAIGITAAYAVVLAARAHFAQSASNWKQAINSDLQLLAASRPTAVNLFWAIARMRKRIAGLEGDPVEELLEEAKKIHREDLEANHRMGHFGAELLDGRSILTHCNTGSLATGGFGTALGVIRSGYSQHKIHRVYLDETRPWLQGARLTAWELKQDGIPATLICEGAAASLLCHHDVSWVIVGADRVAANGDVANKIGTYSLAVNAKQHSVKFMVVAPTSTIDINTHSGAEIEVEQRPADEILYFDGDRIAPAEIDAWNPAFDVTPAAFVDALVTEKTVIRAPDRDKIAALMNNPG